MNTKKEIKNIGEKLILLLSKKNDDYGDSATQGDAIFATKQNMKRMSPKQFGLCCRLDDKIYRIRNSGISYKTIDSLWDIAGYIVLLLITLNHDDQITYKDSVKKEIEKI